MLAGGFAELQPHLQALLEREAQAVADRIRDQIRTAASRKHFPDRRRMGDDEATSHWHWVLFHRGNPLHHLRHHEPWFLAIG